MNAFRSVIPKTGSASHLVAVTPGFEPTATAPGANTGLEGLPGAGVTTAAGRNLPAGNFNLRIVKTFFCR